MGCPEKIIIAGFSGAGKSTLAGRLGDELGLPVAEIDRMCFNSEWRRIPRDEVAKVMEEVCSRDRWIIDQMYMDVADDFISNTDLLIYIEVGLFKNTFNVIKRKIKRILRPGHKGTEGGKKRIQFYNLKRIWIDRKGYSRKWDMLIEKNRGSFEVIRIRRVNERTIRKIIDEISLLSQ